MGNPDYVTVLCTLLAVNVGLFGVAILLTLAPVLLSTFRSKRALEHQSHFTDKAIKTVLTLMRCTIILSLVGSLTSLCGLFLRTPIYLIGAGILVVGSLALMAVATFKLAHTSQLVP